MGNRTNRTEPNQGAARFGSVLFCGAGLLQANAGNVKTLDYWRDRSHEFPYLNRMVRYIKVPATGARIERMFSKSGRVATWTRARPQATTIVETMLYKEFLARLGHPLNEEEERQKAQRKRTRR